MKLYSIMALTLAGFVAGQAMAQLAADPWVNNSPMLDKASQTQQVDSKMLDKHALDFLGDNTTWNTAMGQMEIAPEVNITNVLLMTQHLRNMGYKIPEGLDNLINTAPAKLRNEIYAAMRQLKSSSHPIARVGDNLADIFEKNTGLSLENLIMNSLKVIDSRR